MSTDAWIEEHWIGEAVLPRSRRAPKLPALPVPHAPTCSRGNAALAAHAQSRDSARHPGDGLSARQDGRNVVDQQARKLTQPVKTGCGGRYAAAGDGESAAARSSNTFSAISTSFSQPARKESANSAFDSKKREVRDAGRSFTADDARGSDRLASDRCRAAPRSAVPSQPTTGRPRA